MNEQPEVHTGTWTMVNNPIYWTDCPHCGSTIIMSSPTVIERLKRWARKLLS